MIGKGNSNITQHSTFTPRPATVHGVYVILSVAKNLAWNREPQEILRYAQNDGSFPARERLPRPAILLTRIVR
jgi:hypothetical protein